MNATTIRMGTLLAAAALLEACGDAPVSVDPAGPAEVQVIASQGQVAQWFARSSPEVLSLEGTVFADHDEAANRLVFGVESRAAMPAVRTALARLGIPAQAYVIEVTEPIRLVATLREQWRPTQAGIQIHFGRYLCTLGFNADDGSDRSFITASHCSKRQGGVQGTEYFQPTSTVDPTVIATEVEDPQFFTSRENSACPRGRKCRYSDASRALYSAGVASTRGAIAKTSEPNTGSLDVTGSFTVASQDNATTTFANGTTVNKVGRTTGWTQGNIAGSCVDTNVFASNITLLCQTLVQHPDNLVLVGGGDSGSGVFRITGGDNVELVGILWGGSGSGTLFVFSPLKQIQDELGSLTTIQ